MANGAPRPLIFISYSKFDDEAKAFVERQLGVLRQIGEIEIWQDGEIGVGQDWSEKIDNNLKRCSVAVLLVSADFLGSEFCMKKEVPVLLERRQREGMMIAPILLQHCAWEIVPWLAAIQMQPRRGRPLLTLELAEQAKEMKQVVLAIHGFLEQKRARGNIITVSARGVSKSGGFANAVIVKANTPYPALPQNSVDLTRLPASGYDVVGRDKELLFLNEALDGAKLNVVSLRAWGGVGKSTLVNKWCEYLAADNFRGARRVFAWSFYSQGTNGQVASADAFIDEALRFFGDDDPSAGSPWAKGERLAGLVGGEKALLVLDGLEPLQDEHQGIKDPALARLVECLAERNASLCVITTREPVKEFSDFSETTKEVDLEQLSKEAGRTLLRIKGLRATDDLLEEVSEAFGNHALALNLLANYLKRFAVGNVSKALAIPDLLDVSVDAGRHPRRVMAALADKFCEWPELDLLHVMGLFDRPADSGCIQALREPAVPGLTETLSALTELGWRDMLAKLRGFGLLAEASHHAPDELDAHPLVREHFGMRLRDERGGAWKAGHNRLFKHLQNVPEKDQPDTFAEMAPLFHAVHHGCHAGRQKEALEEVYLKRVNRGWEFYSTTTLGAFGADLGLLACFFDPPFEQPASDFTDSDCAWLLNQVTFHLRALGRFGEAVAPMRAALDIAVTQEVWAQAAKRASSLSAIQLALGHVAEAKAAGKTAVEHADMSADDYQRLVNRTILADALHQSGAIEEARILFADAERIHPKCQPDYLGSIRSKAIAIASCSSPLVRPKPHA